MSNKNIVAIITGASRGFGRTIALRLAHKITAQASGSSLLLYLIARNSELLEKTKNDIHSQTPGDHIHIETIIADLQNSSTNSIASICEQMKSTLNNHFDVVDKVLLFNNAASIGEVSKPSWELTDSQQIEEYFQLNLTSAFVLTSQIVILFKEKLINQTLEMQVIHVSSLLGNPLASPCLSLYCTGKAARNMWFRCLAEDAKNYFMNENLPEKCSLTVLNYSPGTMDTDMAHTLHENTVDKNIKSFLNSAFENGTLVDINTSADKLLRLLHEDRLKWKSGDHVNFSDEI